MIARSTRIVLEVVAAAAAIAVVLAGVAIWRLSQGPVRLDFATPYIEQALAGRDRDPSVEIGATVLAWEGWPETVVLHARDLRVRDAAGRLLAAVPTLELKVSFRALLAGTVAPKIIAVDGARLRLVRETDGSIHFGRASPASADTDMPDDTGGADPADAEGELTGIAPRALEQLMAEPSRREPLSYLQQVRVRDARLILEDRQLGVRWTAPHGNIELNRRAEGVDGSADLRLALDGSTAEVEMALSYRRQAGRIDIAASFRGLEPAALARMAPALAPAAGIGVALEGSLTASLNSEGRVAHVGFDVAASGGRLTKPELFPEPLALREVALRGRFDRAAGRIKVDRAEIALDRSETPGPRLTGEAELTGIGGDTRSLQGRLESDTFPVDDLWRYWPLGVGGNARDWVLENIKTGTVEHAELESEASWPAGNLADLRLGSLDGTIAYSGADVHYLRPLPPVRQVDGTAAFDAGSFRLDIATGVLGDLRVPRADIDITGLDTPRQSIDIDFDAEGPLRQALSVLDRPRLDLVAPLGLDPAATSGVASVTTHLSFPLIAELELDDIEVDSSARLSDVAIDDLVLNKDARGGRFDLSVDKRRLHVVGPVELAGVPLELDWQEFFEPESEYRSLVRAQIPRLDAEGRREFGLETAPYVTGPVSASLIATTTGEGQGELSAALNLHEAALALPLLDWSKPAGEGGTLRLALALRDGQPTALRGFAIEAGGESVRALAAEGAATFAPNSRRLQRAELFRFSVGETDLDRVTVERRETGGWSLALGGSAIDATPILEDMFGPADTGGDEGSGAGDEEDGQGSPSASTPDGEDPVPIALRLDSVGRVKLGPGRYLEDVTLVGERGPGGWWHRLELDARLPTELLHVRPGKDGPPAPPEERRLSLAYVPGPDGRRELTFTSANAGAVLRVLDAVDTVEGGRVRIQGQSRSPDPSSALDIKTRIDDFRVLEAPVMARLLTVASFTGIRDLLRGDGITFSRFTGEVTVKDGRVTTDLIRAYGPALGLTAKGEVDVRRDRADLEGTIVPAYSVNSVLGRIPVLGQIFVGGEGEGVFAVTYGIRGPVSDPTIVVNPLSVLAPGFLRGIFGLLDGEADAGEAPRALPSQPMR